MRRTVLLLTVACLWEWSAAAVFVRPCGEDLSALTYRDIMVGKEYPLLVYADANDLWSGSLFIEDTYRDLGSLHGRDKDPNSRDWAGSHLDAAGLDAQVIAWNDSAMSGFDFYNDVTKRRPGHWFIVDYRADKPGTCKVDFYQHPVSWTLPDPNQSIIFENIANRDLNLSDVVNFQDFGLFSQYWLCQDCTEPSWCNGADMDQNGQVGIEDVVLFAEYWLWGTPNWQRAPQIIAGEPNLVYAIRDANDVPEITMFVGTSNTLYLTQEADGEQTNIFSLEVNISDPNYGMIDNTEIDPNNPAGGTAHILISPRDPWFDYYGPGYKQTEGIYMLGVSLWEPIADGALASFVYTATQPGDVILSVMHENIYPARLESILIHQILPPTPVSSASAAETVELLEEIYDSSEELQASVPEQEWNSFIDSVTGTDDPNQL
ncbi:MAG: hypothetical protein JXB18_07415 [Sedimentisphaerales bacterium]|nr:hypothetical protein [Sedimentisphaerales bacterium]